MSDTSDFNDIAKENPLFLNPEQLELERQWAFESAKNYMIRFACQSEALAEEYASWFAGGHVERVTSDYISNVASIHSLAFPTFLNALGARYVDEVINGGDVDEEEY